MMDDDDMYLVVPGEFWDSVQPEMHPATEIIIRRAAETVLLGRVSSVSSELLGRSVEGEPEPPYGPVTVRLVKP